MVDLRKEAELRSDVVTTTHYERESEPSGQCVAKESEELFIFRR